MRRDSRLCIYVSVYAGIPDDEVARADVDLQRCAGRLPRAGLVEFCRLVFWPRML